MDAHPLDRHIMLKGAYIEVTTTCNMGCPYCYNDSSPRSPKHISVDNMQAVFSALRESGAIKVTLSGGEPLMHPCIREIVELGNYMNLKYDFITNSSLVTNEVARWMKKAWMRCQVTIDGPNDSIHDKTRGVGNFASVQNAVKILIQNGVETIARCNISDTNYEYVLDIIEMANEWGIRGIDFSFIISSPGRGYAFYGKHSILEEPRIVLRVLQALNSATKSHGSMELKVPHLGGSYDCPFFIENAPLVPRITPDGSVYPCQNFAKGVYSMGNINDQKLLDIINGERMTGFMVRMKKWQSELVECRKCVASNICAGGCPAASLEAERNQMHESLCVLRRQKHRQIMRNAISRKNSE